MVFEKAIKAGIIIEAEHRICVEAINWSAESRDGLSAKDHMTSLVAIITRLLAAAEKGEQEFNAMADPSICRMQFPDGLVPSNILACAEGWKWWYGSKVEELKTVKEYVKVLESRTTLVPTYKIEQVRNAWEAGFALCRSYADNHYHFEGEQKEKKWKEFCESRRLAQGDPSVGGDKWAGWKAWIDLSNGYYFYHDGDFWYLNWEGKLSNHTPDPDNDIQSLREGNRLAVPAKAIAIEKAIAAGLVIGEEKVCTECGFPICQCPKVKDMIPPSPPLTESDVKRIVLNVLLDLLQHTVSISRHEVIHALSNLSKGNK